MIVIATHAVFFNDKDIYGPPHAISLFLNKKKIEHVFIKHRLEDSGYTKVEYYKNGKLLQITDRGSPKRSLFIIQYISEIYLTIKIITKEVKSCELFIGVDPLNALAGILLKIGKKAKKTVFFCADFALKRFENPVLNKTYLLLDTISMNYSDETWSVSKRIVDYRKKQGLSSRKNVHIPNAPPFKDMEHFRKQKLHENDLIIVSKLYTGVDFKQIFLALIKLHKYFPKLKLHIIGDGEEMDNVKKQIDELKLKKSVIIYGARDHSFVHKLMASSYLGFALYVDTQNTDFRYFSDSMKMRDYMACGTPVIATGNTITGYEVQDRKAGIVLPLSDEAIFRTIKKLKKSKRTYSQMRKNALILAEENDIYNIIENKLHKLKII